MPSIEDSVSTILIQDLNKKIKIPVSEVNSLVPKVKKIKYI